MYSKTRIEDMKKTNHALMELNKKDSRIEKWGDILYFKIRAANKNNKASELSNEQKKLIVK